ncbi:SDR family oxidoreductase [Burkholderia gladioli]|uniref:SDR family oxidoreductase n=1 Tax=Burkholderia gladioli TaxID=28095 RepID=UPI0034DB58F8
MDKTLQGKVALVTGGSRGLGAATAAALAARGADVAISYVASKEKAEAVVARLRETGVRAVAIRADQGDTGSAEPLVREVLAALGRLDIVVNNAAIAVIRAAARVLPEGGRIISVGSGVGTRVLFAGATDYAATKAAIVGYTRGAARDLGARGITVNVVQAGIMDTDMAAGARDALPSAVLDSHAIRRIAELDEVAAAIVFLAGPDAGYITGSVIDVNGGYTA